MESKEVFIAQEIERNLEVLRQTDYKAIKFAEGELSESEYAPIREQRRQCRNAINMLEMEYKDLLNGKYEETDKEIEEYDNRQV